MKKNVLVNTIVLLFILCIIVKLGTMFALGSKSQTIDSLVGETKMEVTTRITKKFRTKHETDVTVEVESSKKLIQLGDSFTVTYRIINNLPSAIIILPNLIYRGNSLRFFTQDTQDLSWRSNTHYEWNFQPEKTEFISIESGNVFEAVIPFLCKAGNIYINTNKDYYDGIYFYTIADSYYLLNSEKEIKIQGLYYLVDSEQKNMIKYGFAEGLLSNLSSEIITLQLLD